MFSVGQTVYHRTRNHTGKVLESDGATTYLVQPNGVEADFPTADLTATAPREKSGPAPVSPVPSRILTAADIGPEHRKVLAIIPQRTLQAVALLHDRNPKAGRFSALDPAQKLNYIAEATAVPYRTMKEFSDRPGELGLMMGRGLSIGAGR